METARAPSDMKLRPGWNSLMLQSAGSSRQPHPMMRLRKPFTLHELESGLFALCNRKAAGLDGLPVELLKYSGAAGLSNLTHLFNVVYDSGCVVAGKGDFVHAYKRTPAM